MEKQHFKGPEPHYCKVIICTDIIVFILLSLGFVFLYFLVFGDKEYSVYDTVYISVVSVLLLSGLGISISVVKKVWHFRGYALRTSNVTIRKGIFFPSFTTVSFHKIQSVEIRQNPIMKLYNLYDLVIINGAQYTNTFYINGLTKLRAEEIKSFIIQQQQTESYDGTNPAE